MNKVKQLTSLTKDFSPEKLLSFLRLIAPSLRPQGLSLSHFLKEDSPFDIAEQIGVIELPDMKTVIVATVHVKGELTNRSSKRKQYELAKRILKDGNHNAGIFAFYDDNGRFRLSLVTVTYHGTKRQFSTFRRHTFFVDPDLPNKTFIQQFRKAEFSGFEGILETFSLEAVSDEFYREFEPKFEAIKESVQGTDDDNLKHDFALLFVIRTIFIGFLQKRGWIGDNQKFLQDFWKEYQGRGFKDRFYKEWLDPLFFEALKLPPGSKVSYGHSPFSKETEEALQMAPYLNGELFEKKGGVDDQALWIPDEIIGEFLDFIFQYNFTVEENELYDEELELNPEFLGIIFERLTNMEQGAVYTPRIEVDLMSRLALVKWLSQTTEIPIDKLYQFFFGEKESVEFSSDEIEVLIKKLESVTVCDPAAGSGAFLVGMLQVIDKTLDYLYSHPNAPIWITTKIPSPFERKKSIVERSLYGVEVKKSAVWISQLRLWLSLFVDIPEESRYSYEPLLPSLMFKVRAGDSLVQRIGNKSFPVHGHEVTGFSSAIRAKIADLKKLKRAFFNNRIRDPRIVFEAERNVFRAILNYEIQEKIKEIRRLSSPKGEMGVLEGIGPKKPVQEELLKANIEQLRAEIAELQDMKRRLSDKPIFLWSIQFAEVFFERGGFDIVIGNPPYVRRRDIVDPSGKHTPNQYVDALMEMLLLDFPDYFAKSKADRNRFKKGRKISKDSDLYTYFYIRSLRLLNEKGVHVFICSNAWLDVGYGTWLQEFFLRKAPLYMVIDNHARRSFVRADINTIITVASSPLKRVRVPRNHIVRFVAFKKPFEEAVSAENFIAIENATKTIKTDTYRVFPLTVGELLKEGSEAMEGKGSLVGEGIYVGNKWGGKYLRAPDIFFTILEKGKGKLVRLGEVAEVRRGFTTGANDFFYLEPLGPGSRPGLVRVRNGAGWEGEIEGEFLKPVIKSPREVKTIVIKPEDLRYRIFMCHKSKEELKGTKALEYIEWGERQGYHERPTLRGRRCWWDLGNRNPGLYLWPMIHNNRLAVFLNSSGVQVDHNLFEITPHDLRKIIISIFSILSVLIRELYGRSNLGEGALKTEGIDIKKFYSLAVEIDDSIKEILERFQIQSLFTEIGIDPESDIPISEQEPNPLPDRKALDDIVFDALGLTDEERKEVYRAVAQLVWERISKARSGR